MFRHMGHLKPLKKQKFSGVNLKNEQKQLYKVLFVKRIEVANICLILVHVLQAFGRDFLIKLVFL